VASRSGFTRPDPVLASGSIRPISLIRPRIHPLKPVHLWLYLTDIQSS
jgi:hypothetical protein